MFLTASDTVGMVNLSASGVVGDSGKPQILYGYAFKSDSTAGTLTLFNGTSSVSPSIYAWDQTGIISSTVFNPLGVGVVFKNGIFASFDGHVTSGAFFVKQFIS